MSDGIDPTTEQYAQPLPMLKTPNCQLCLEVGELYRVLDMNFSVRYWPAGLFQAAALHLETGEAVMDWALLVKAPRSSTMA
jgi:hypothetical protein